MAKKIYESLNYKSEDTEISLPVAYVQAARALDAAAERAVELNDGETLARVAELWIKIAENLGGDSDNEKEEEVHEHKSLGFTVHYGEEEEIAAESEEGRDGEHEDLQSRRVPRVGGSRYRVHPQSRQL